MIFNKYINKERSLRGNRLKRNIKVLLIYNKMIILQNLNLIIILQNLNLIILQNLNLILKETFSNYIDRKVSDKSNPLLQK